MTISRSLRALFLLMVPLVVYGGCGGDDEPTGPGDDNVVGPAGGTLSFGGGAVVLTFPPNAVDSDLEVSVSEATGPSNDLLLPGTVHELGPDGTTFAVPVTLALRYDPEELAEGVLESELRVFRVVGGAWSALESSSVNAAGNTATGQIQGFSRFGVLALPVASVTLTPAAPTLELGNTIQLDAVLESASGMTLAQRPVEWESSNGSVATVSSTGSVTGVSGGSATITATSEGVEGSTTVTVNVPVAQVEVEPGSAELAVGETVSLMATPRAVDGTPLDREVDWESSAEAVATVDDAGLVTAQGEGSATITATSGGVEGTAQISVVNPIASVEVTAAVQGIVEGGETDLEAIVRDGAGGVLEGVAVTWSSSDESVATIAADGTVTAVAPGVVTLTATAGDVEGSVELTVTLDWTAMEGAWSGTWTNTTFGSSDAIDLDVTVDVATLTVTIIIDVDGPVLGASDPLPMTVVGTLAPTTVMIDHEAPLHGRIVVDLSLGEFEVESIDVPASGFESWSYAGTNTMTTHSASFTVTFDGGGTAEGVVEVNRL